jgi:uncharacterized membrane protein
METTIDLLSPGWLIAGYAALAAASAAALRSAPWRRLRTSQMQHALFGSCVALIGLWWIRAGIVPGLGFHFFGVTTVTLMFGWQFACLAAIPVLLAGLWTGHGDLPALGLNAAVLFVLPAAISWAVHRLACRFLPRNFFVYVFINCYLAAALSMGAATVAMTGVLVASGTVEPGYVWREFLPFLPMLLLAEGFINGTVTAVLVATRPDWVWTFDDAVYLRG